MWGPRFFCVEREGEFDGDPEDIKLSDVATSQQRETAYVDFVKTDRKP